MRNDPTIGERLTQTSGRPTGFDYLRLTLACGIVCFHSIVTSYGIQVQEAVNSTEFRPLIAILLPAFFSLSGFLVAGSLERCSTLFSFLALRCIRIFPALAVESIISAFILGSIFTTLPITGYFLSPLFLSYLKNIYGDIHYTLPGVFQHNPNPMIVNGQMWTIPYEFLCYASITALALFGAVRKRIMVPVAAAVLSLAEVFVHAHRHGWLDKRIGALHGPLLVASFLCGVALYLYRDKIRWRGSTALVAAVVTFICLEWLPNGDGVVPFSSAYLTVYLGLQNPKKAAILRSADYSYGIFLYGYPVQQAVASLGAWARHWEINLVFTFPVVVGLSAISWNVVEKPALALRKPLVRLEARVLSFWRPHPLNDWWTRSVLNRGASQKTERPLYRR